MTMPYLLNPQHEILGKDTVFTDGFVRIGYHDSGKIAEVYCSPFSFETDMNKAVRTVFVFDNNGHYSGALFYNRYNTRVQYELIDQYRFVCDQKGRIIKRINQNKGGLLVSDLSCYQYQYEWDDANNLIQIIALNEYGAIQERSATHVFEYNALNQLIKKSRYLLTKTGTLGEFFDAYAYQYDNLGRVSQETYNWNSISEQIKLFSYNEAGFLASIKFVSKEGNPTRCEDGYHCVRFEYNTEGNKTAAHYYDLDDELQQYGLAHEYRTYDQNGQLLHNYFKDLYLEPIANRSGVRDLKYVYDEKGRLVESEKDQSSDYYSELYDITEQDYLKILYTYDHQNRIIEMRYQTKVDSTQNLITGRTIKFKYNDQNQVIDKWFENLVLLEEGVYDTRIDINAFTYDANGNITEHQYLDRNRKLVFNEFNSYARIAKVYNTKNQLVEESRFNENNEPFENYEFPGRKAYQYDENGYCTEECTYPISYGEFKDTLICTQKTFTENGLVTKIAYLDGYGNLFPSLGEIAMITYRYDAQNRLIEVANYDREGKLIEPEVGTAITRYLYDSDGNKLEESYFGASNEPVEDYNGIAKYTYRYDNKGNQIEIANFNKFGQLTLGHFGEYAIFQKTLSSDDELKSVTHFNPEKQKTYHADYHGYDAFNETYFFPSTGRIWKTTSIDNGNQIRVAVYDEKGRLNTCSINVYDEAGHLESQRWVDEQNRLKNNISGYAFHNVIDNTFYTEKNKLIPPKKILEMLTSYYELISFDEQGNRLETSFLNHHLKPTLMDGYHSFNYLNNRYYDTNGKEVIEVNSSDY
jgi:hypothetical protein